MMDGIDHMLEVHVWHTVEPMHQTLYVYLTADIIAQTIQKTVEEGFHLDWAAQACNCQEASRIE